jgi:hypothetical protein
MQEGDPANLPPATALPPPRAVPPGGVAGADPANAKLVKHLYQSLLGREADASGLANWSRLLREGHSRDEVVAGIMSSREYRMKVIDALYEKHLGRHAEDRGMESWLRYLAAGHTAGQVEGQILGSEEFFRRAGEGGFLEALYRSVLGRGRDASGANSWGTKLAHGTSRASVAMGVLESQEARSNAVEGWYNAFLERQADDRGLAHFVSALGQDMTGEEVVGRILSSEEFAGKSGT